MSKVGSARASTSDDDKKTFYHTQVGCHYSPDHMLVNVSSEDHVKASLRVKADGRRVHANSSCRPCLVVMSVTRSDEILWNASDCVQQWRQPALRLVDGFVVCPSPQNVVETLDRYVEVSVKIVCCSQGLGLAQGRT
jgi:hypothetical protein